MNPKHSLHTLQQSIEADTDWKHHNKIQLLDYITQAPPESSNTWNDIHVTQWNTLGTRLLISFSVIGFCFLLPMTPVWAQYSRPGRVLFPVAKLMESSQLWLADSDQERTQIKEEVSLKRIRDLQSAVLRSDDERVIAATVQEVQATLDDLLTTENLDDSTSKQMQKQLKTLQTLTTDEKLLSLLTQLQQQLSNYQQPASQYVQQSVPTPTQPESQEDTITEDSLAQEKPLASPQASNNPATSTQPTQPSAADPATTGHRPTQAPQAGSPDPDTTQPSARPTPLPSTSPTTVPFDALAADSTSQTSPANTSSTTRASLNETNLNIEISDQTQPPQVEVNTDPQPQDQDQTQDPDQPTLQQDQTEQQRNSDRQRDRDTDRDRR